ncbi:MAG: histidine--tRNA ligase [Candidatus Woesearchaeota archaeon]
MKLETAKGVKDIKPEEKILRERVISILKEVFELYGYNPLETPIVERFDVLASKYAGGEEILREIFKLKDQGKRDLALRYDLTVPFSRFVGMNPTLKMPFKRYEIGNVFRDGPLTSSRLRQFYQCDVDVVGTSSMMADAEFIEIANLVFKKLDMKVFVRVNNRKILDDIILRCNVKKNLVDSVILSIDKLDKIDDKGVKDELLEKGVSKTSISRLLKLISIKGTNKQKLDFLKREIGESQGLKEISELMKYSKDFVFDVSLARGLSYYTGTVFEVYLKNSEVKTSVAAGGRYDNMIGNFLGGKREYPAVGISFGLDRIVLAMKKEKFENIVKVYVIPIGIKEKAFEIVEKLRENGINSDIDFNSRSISKNLDYASKLNIPYVIFLGEKELKLKKFKLKDMNSGKECLLDFKELVKKIKKN